MGGLVGGLYAAGKSPAELRAIIEETDWDAVLSGQMEFRDLTFRRKEDPTDFPSRLEFGLRNGLRLPPGLNAGQQIGFIIDRAVLPWHSLSSFDELPTPFRCVGTDLTSGTPKVFSDGELSRALRATMSLPTVFNPVRTKDAVYVDGGLLNNLPVDVVRKMGADIVIAVYLKTAPPPPSSYYSFLQVLDRSISVMISAAEMRNIEQADILVTVDLETLTGTDYKKFTDIISRGRQSAERKADRRKDFWNNVAAGRQSLRRQQSQSFWKRSGRGRARHPHRSHIRWRKSGRCQSSKMVPRSRPTILNLTPDLRRGGRIRLYCPI